MNRKREKWIDYIKVLACMLVLLGHFFQSMMKANIISNSVFYKWFITTIYYFHVPLFFICSGYLYQKYSRVTDFKMWVINIRKKAIMLGVPYFVFSFITWVLKTIFSSSVNTQVGSIVDFIFIHPTSPYWFLYILFFIFVITPTFNSNSLGIKLLFVALIVKSIRLTLKLFLWEIFVVSGVFDNEIWFILGMNLAIVGTNKLRNKAIGGAIGIAFLFLSLFGYSIKNEWVGFGLGIMACLSIFMLLIDCREILFLNIIGRYTMPIFLMHTIFAAPVRILLIKMGIISIVPHLFLGLIISIIGPIISFIILKKIRMAWIIIPNIDQSNILNIIK